MVHRDQEDWITAMAKVPAFSQWSVTIDLAGLGNDFSRVEKATVFAPTVLPSAASAPGSC